MDAKHLDAYVIKPTAPPQPCESLGMEVAHFSLRVNKLKTADTQHQIQRTSKEDTNREPRMTDVRNLSNSSWRSISG